LLLLFVHLAHITKNLKFGCGFNINPMWHPLRLAEDFATADHLTDGRVVFGVGRGYHSREVETFGNPSTAIDNDANRQLFEEQTELLMKAFNQRSFSHHGEYYDIPPHVPYRGYELEEITLVPRPKNLPVECWQPIVSSSVRGLDFMVKHGIKAISGGGAAPGGASRRVVEAWRDAHARAGIEKDLGEDMIVGEKFHIAESREKAIEEARPYFEENTKMFGPLGFVAGLTEDQKEELNNPSEELIAALPTIEEDVASGNFLCGTPEEIIEPLMLLQDIYPGLREINIQPLISTPRAVILEQIERFAKEVMPAFKTAKTAAS
jgi:alkanesulfonate monooxygenase SsuD/methylene tetrahydromethanopterin reductase-like flavin-dependent oxidoreductase (luciferase family)